MKFEINWDPEMTNFYDHGSCVNYVKEGVQFENKLMSLGGTIVEWISNPSYQARKGFLELPLLERGRSYHVQIDVDAMPKSNVLLKVEFYNRSEESVGRCLIVTQSGIITYPKAAYSYRISLLNNGIETLFFRRIIIQSFSKGGDALD